jgi:pilus assembly protein CpaC
MSFMTHMRPRAFRLSLAVFIIVILVAAPEAAQQYQPTSYSADGTVTATANTNTIDLLVGRSTVLNVTSPIARLSLTVPDIADAMVTSPQQVLIHGKAPGTISLFVWDKAGAIRTYEVSVRRDLSVLSNQLRQLFPGEPITVTGSGKDVVLSGRVSTPYIVEKAAEVAIAYAEKKENVVNLLKMQEGIASNQVMLKVRFAEVSRSAVQELGASFVANGYKNDWYGRTSTQQFPSPEWNQDGKLVFSDFLNLFVLNSKEGIGGVIRALSNKGLFQSLAEPNLIAMDGKEASFLAGGEFPFPVSTPTNGGGYTITVMFKEFGVRLNFTPTILSEDMVRLKVRPEVSSLDFSSAVTTNGFRVPALSTRRTETEVELQNGQTFAIAGLMNNTLTNTMTKIPGIGDIPVLGLLFRSKAHQKNQTELVVMITPYIVRRGSHGVSEGIPNLVEPYLGAPSKSLPPPAPYTGSPRYGVAQPGSEATIQPPQTPAAAPANRQGSPAKPAPSQKADQPSSAPVKVQPAPVQKLSKEDERRIAEARKREQMERAIEAKRQAEAQAAAAKAAAAEQKRQEEAARIALEKAADDQKKLEAATREQSQKDAEAARKAAADKKKAEEQQKKLAAEEAKRQRALAEAAAKVKEAQSAYEAVVRTTPGKPLP